MKNFLIIRAEALIKLRKSMRKAQGVVEGEKS
jgi:hypothetical protein